MLIVVTVLIFILVIGIFLFYSYRNCVILEKKVNSAFSKVDNAMKKRWDLVPYFLEFLRSNHVEHELLPKVSELRNNSYHKMDNKDKIRINKIIDQLVVQLIDEFKLKNEEQFSHLNEQFSITSQEIKQTKEYYNTVVKAWNDQIGTFPSFLIANIFNFNKKEFLN